MDKLKAPAFIILIMLNLMFLYGCIDQEHAVKISLEKREDTVIQTPSSQPIRIAVSAMVSPEGTLENYQKMLDYISERTGTPVELVQRHTYSQINELVEAQYIDAAFVCTGAYVKGHDKFQMELLVAPVFNGSPYYYSYIIVNNDSDFKSIEDLRQRRFAFTDEMSNSGKLAPTYMLALMNEKPESFFSSYIFTYSHDRSIEAVAKHIVDGAAVDSLIWEYENRTDPVFTSKTRVIEKSQPFATPPVIVHPDAPHGFKMELKEIFLEMHNDPEGKQILNNLGIDRFTEIDDTSYDSVRMMNKLVEE